jgi:hypothetical protein
MGMQNGFNSIQQASENMAADIQPKSETEEQIADLKREQEEEATSGEATSGEATSGEATSGEAISGGKTTKKRTRRQYKSKKNGSTKKSKK